MEFVLAYNPCGWCPYKENGERCGMCELTFRRKEWISVDERLPETTENVLGCSDKDGGCIFIGYYRSDWDLWGENGLLHLGHVLYWMPLPEAPKGGGKENNEK